MYIADIDKNVTSRGHIEELHCLLKHLLHAEGHTEEVMANFSRQNNDVEVMKFSKILDTIRSLRQDIFKSCYECGELEFKKTHASNGCMRCVDDLKTKNIGDCPSCLMV